MLEKPMTPDLPETDDALLIRMRSGDERAFVALYRRRQAAIYRFALAYERFGDGLPRTSPRKYFSP